MNTPSKNNAGTWVAALCLGLVPIQNQAAEFVELSAEIETFAYRLRDTNNIAKAKPKMVKVKCITGSTGWSIEHDYLDPQRWLCDGTNVVLRAEKLRATDPDGVKMESRD